MINFPSEQNRLQEELDRVVGRARLPALGDMKNLPYTEAVINEVHRRASVIAISFYHNAVQETDIAGYTFTGSDFITPNLYEVHHDPGSVHQSRLSSPESGIQI